MELGFNMTHAKTYGEAYRYAVQIPSLYRQRIEFGLDGNKYHKTLVEVYDPCQWLAKDAIETSNDAETMKNNFFQLERVKGMQL